MKSTLLITVFCLFIIGAKSQNLLLNSNLNNTYVNWDNNGQMPEIGGIYPTSAASAYWFENIYGGPSTTNLVSQLLGDACMSQNVCVLKGTTYTVSFKASRRTSFDCVPVPNATIVMRVLGNTSFTMYSEEFRTFSNTVWGWTNVSYNFTIPPGAGDNIVRFSLCGNPDVIGCGVVVDDVTIVPAPSITVNGPSVVAVNMGSDWSVDNVPGTGVTYNWTFPGAVPSTSTLANPTNVQWSSQGPVVVSCVIGNGSCNVVTINKAISVNATLPVNLVSFNAQINNNTVDLNWLTSQEINNDYFEVYRSKNAINWDLIGKVNANAVGNGGATYSLKDAHPAFGVNNYYKLKQVDKNGAYKFSNVVRANLKNGDKQLDAFVYPSIVSSLLSYVVENPKAGRLQVFLSDVSGKRLSQSVEYFTAGTTQKTIDVSKFAQGIYLLTIADETQSFKKSITFKKD